MSTLRPSISRENTGASLLELVVALSIFALLSLAIFELFQLGTQNFALGVARNDLQLQARRCTALLNKELSRSSMESVGVVKAQVTVGGVVYARDALSFSTLDDWNDGGNFETVGGLPVWNRYLVFYATTAEPLGEFAYSSIVPSTVPASEPWDNMGGTFPTVSLASAAGMERSVSLSQSLLRFEVDLQPEVLGLDFLLTGTTQDSRRRSEHLQLKLKIQPTNR